MARIVADAETICQGFVSGAANDRRKAVAYVAAMAKKRKSQGGKRGRPPQAPRPPKPGQQLVYIRERRDALDMTQDQLADALGWDKTTITRIELNYPDHSPNAHKLRAIADVLKCKPDDLLKPMRPADEPPQQSVDQMIAVLPPIDQQKIVDIVKILVAQRLPT